MPMSPLEKKLGYSFNNQELLKQALTRQSAIEEKNPLAASQSYQSLELIGDAALKHAIAKRVYEKLQNNCNEKKLHTITSSLIENKTVLPQIARKLKLDSIIIKGKGETSVTDKMLADALEAVLGAISMDNQRQKGLYDIIFRLWDSYIDNAIKKFELDPVKPPIKLESIILSSEQTASGKEEIIEQNLPTNKIERLLSKAEIRHADEKNIIFTNLNSAKNFAIAICNIGIGDQNISGELQPRIINIVTENKSNSESYIVNLTANEFKKLNQGPAKIIAQTHNNSQTKPTEHKPVDNNDLVTPSSLANSRPISPTTQRVFKGLSRKISVHEFEKDVSKMSDVNRRNTGKKSDTPLMMFLRKPGKLRPNCDIPKMEILLKYGASWTATNDKGVSADKLAEKHDQEVITKLKNAKK